MEESLRPLRGISSRRVREELRRARQELEKTSLRSSREKSMRTLRETKSVNAEYSTPEHM